MKRTHGILGAALLTLAAPASMNAQEVVLRAMQDEMKRSIERLALDGAERPYFIQYTVEDLRSHYITASFGSITSSRAYRSRDLNTSVRVGGYEQDNSGFFDIDDLFRSFDAPNDLVIEDDYDALRHDLWLATDFYYKQAVQTLAKKRAALSNKAEKEPLPDFSKETPTRHIAPPNASEIDVAGWERDLRAWSEIFRKYPAILGSRVVASLRHTTTLIVNSEGTVVQQPGFFVSVVAYAQTQAPDGARISHSVAIDAVDPSLARNGERARAQIERLARELTELAAAPTLESTYSGPVLFSAEASASMLAQLLTPHLSGERPPMLGDQRYASMLGRSGELGERINRPVMASFLSVVDDPSKRELDGRLLWGSYEVDDEGVAARPLTLIERGTLKTLVMSRRPSKTIAASNGRARGGNGGTPTAIPSNLIVSADEGKSDDELKQELIELCRAQSLPFGVMVRTLKAERDDDESSVIIIGQSNERRSPVSDPLVAVKVYVDGREELVRGVTIGELSLRSLRDIAAAGTRRAVYHRYSSPAGPSRSGGVPMSVVAPALLFEELEIRSGGGPQSKPVLLTHPFFEGGGRQ